MRGSASRRMRRWLLVVATAALLLGGSIPATGVDEASEPAFRRVATFPVYLNTELGAETVAEIVDVTWNGKTLVYTDGASGGVGFVDINDPSDPRADGFVGLTGEPTSVAVAGPYALVAVNTSDTFTNPSGHLTVIQIASRRIVAELDLGGQPDAVSVSDDGRLAAIAIENERDEDVDDGLLPQLPGGFLAVVELRGAPDRWGVDVVDLTGLADYAPSDPEPEYVDIDGENIAVVTLQENNHLVLVDLEARQVIGDFPAGGVDLTGIDATEDGVIEPSESLSSVPREPDAVTWLPGGFIATADEGDLFGGSRGFTIFDDAGTPLFAAGNEVEHLAIRHGHYPENRSENKGNEPEGIAYGRYRGMDHLFVGSERGSFIAVYRLNGGAPEFHQLLPAGLGPEGILPIPARDLLVVSSEVDDPPFGIRSTISIYQLADEPSYPDLVSGNEGGVPIGWGAISGLVGDPADSSTVYAVWDSFYSEGRIFSIDVSQHPAMITGYVEVTGGSASYDPEGVAVEDDGDIWIASEGRTGTRPNLLIETDADTGAILRELGLPAGVEACRAGGGSRLDSGFEGVAIADDEVWVVQQRGWSYTDPGCVGLEDADGFTRIWVYDLASETWSSVRYELEPTPATAGWVGLSEISILPDGSLAVIERDNATGAFSEVKWLVRIEPADLTDGVVTRSEKQAYDVLSDMRGTNGWIHDKLEGVAVATDGQVYVVTDNDGVDDASGETQFLPLGSWESLFD